MTFYDRNGKPIAYTEDDEYIFLFTGEPVAYLYDNTVYGYDGRQFGWFENGWVRDLHGSCVFFTENATGSGPVKPVKQVKPVKSVKRIKPVKCARHARRAKTAKCLAWSDLSGKHFFNQ